MEKDAYDREIAPMPCKHRAGVVCDDRWRCPLCGWNDAVEAARRRRLRAYGADALTGRRP